MIGAHALTTLDLSSGKDGVCPCYIGTRGGMNLGWSFDCRDVNSIYCLTRVVRAGIEDTVIHLFEIVLKITFI
jgi:hypothetical protein